MIESDSIETFIECSIGSIKENSFSKIAADIMANGQLFIAILWRSGGLAMWRSGDVALWRSGGECDYPAF